MKKSNLILGAMALILTIAGAFVTKAAKINHVLCFATRGSAGVDCNLLGRRASLTKTVRTGHTFITVARTTFTCDKCLSAIYTVAD